VLETHSKRWKNSIINFLRTEFPADFPTEETYKKRCTGKLSIGNSVDRRTVTTLMKSNPSPGTKSNANRWRLQGIPSFPYGYYNSQMLLKWSCLPFSNWNSESGAITIPTVSSRQCQSTAVARESPSGAPGDMSAFMYRLGICVTLRTILLTPVSGVKRQHVVKPCPGKTMLEIVDRNTN